MQVEPGAMSLEITSKVAEIDAHIIDVLRHRVGKDERAAKPHDWYTATCLALRDVVIDRWMESTRKTYDEGGKRVYYLSLEFLIGRLLRDALSNLGLTREMEKALGGSLRGRECVTSPPSSPLPGSSTSTLPLSDIKSVTFPSCLMKVRSFLSEI
jgi:hypothetical protein